ncbi:hypothetical protein [Nocardia brasiliensis]|uniref:hypothetical protein n=1 Tax=Nocardia brasiliensis TaxID=37326 RepID=UPI0024566618|nr:hypothetical protein [Nocardia brasiliensis]
MDGYDRDRDPYSNNDRGRIFENGTFEHYQLRDRGYVQQSQIFRVPGIGNVQFDKIAHDQGKVLADEDKSGRMDGKKDEKQLEVVYELLKTGKIDHYTLRTVEHELISDRCQELIDKIRSDFPEKSTHLIIDRETAREVWAKGVAAERGLGQQLELDKVREQAREAKAQAIKNRREQIAEIAKKRERKQRAQERLANVRKIEQARAEKERMTIAAEQAARAMLREAPIPGFFRDRITVDHSKARDAREATERAAREEHETRQHEQARDQELAKTAESREQLKAQNAELAQAIEEQAREINSAWDKGEAIAVENVREAHTNMSQNLEAIREAEIAQTRNDFLVSGHTPEEVQAIEPRLEQIREDNRHEIVQGINTLGAIVERGDQARDRADHEAAAERQREQERAAQREAARAQDAARQAACERLQQQGRLTDAERALWLGQATDPHAAVRERPGIAPQVQGHGRDGQGQSRGISRDR